MEKLGLHLFSNLTKIRNFNVFIFICFFLFTLYLSQQRGFPYLYDDEYGVLGAGAIFSGLEWSTPANMPFYGFLLSLFTFPLYWLDLEPTVLYRSILAMNAIFVASSALLAMKTIRLLPGSHSEISRIGIVIAGFSYPAIQFYSPMALGEIALLFCFFLIAYHLTVLLNSSQARIFNAIFLGIGIGMAQYAHPRGVAFVIAGFIVILYALRAKSISRKQFTVTAIFALSTILLLASVKTYLLTTFYNHEHISSSVSSFVHSRLASLNTDGLLKLIQVSFGQLTYLLTSTFGLLIPGGAILALTTWKNVHDCEMKLKSNSDKFIANVSGTLSGFVLLSFALMFTASVLQLFNAQRADHFFYGRYNEVMLPALIITSLLFLVQLPKKKALYWIIASFFISLLSILALSFYPEEIFQRTTVWTNITSWLVHGTWKINPKYILSGVSTACIVLAISVMISRKLFIMVLIAFFISAALHNFEVQHKGADKEWQKFDKLANKFGLAMFGMQLQAIEPDLAAKLKREDLRFVFSRAEALQFAFPKAHVSFNEEGLSNADAVLDYEGWYCNEKNTVAYLDKAKFCIINESLRAKVKITAAPSNFIYGKSRTRPAANFKVSEKVRLDGIKIGFIDRACTAIASNFYTGWFHYCLPAIDIIITQNGSLGNEGQQLGIFITDSKGKWLREWRVDVDNQRIARNKQVKITSFIQVPPKINKGHHWLNVAIIDSHGWDWRTTMKIRLTVK